MVQIAGQHEGRPGTAEARYRTPDERRARRCHDGIMAPGNRPKIAAIRSSC
jgi:hypothetical protein